MILNQPNELKMYVMPAFTILCTRVIERIDVHAASKVWLNPCNMWCLFCGWFRTGYGVSEDDWRVDGFVCCEFESIDDIGIFGESSAPCSDDTTAKSD
jgi:hypothetical protein